TYNLIMTNEDAAKANGNFVTNFKSVVAKDDHTLVITTKAPQATMLALDIPIVPEHIWKGQNPKTYKPEDHTPTVGDGPFILTDYKAGQYVKFKANKNYWRGAPKIDQLVFQEFANPDAAVQALQKGEVDLISGTNAAQTKALEKDKNITVNKAQGKRFTELSINTGAETTKGVPIGDGNPALKDKRVREAISMAVDRKTIVNKVLQGYAEPADGYIPALYKTYHWSPAPSEKIGFDLKKANQILDQAGYKKGSDGIRTMPGSGEKLNLRFEGHNEAPEELQIGNYLKSWLKQIGIGLKVTVVSDTKLNDDLPKGKFDLLMGGWTVNPDPDYVLNIQRCDARPSTPGGSSTTDQYYCSKKYDQLYDQQLSTFDQAKRAAIVKHMQQVMYDDIPSIMIDYPETVEAYRSDRWKPFQTQPDPGGRILGQDGFWGIYSADPKAGSGGGNGATIGITAGVVVVVAAAAGFVFLRRRGATADERE
ncbi:MAG TPA: peptide ABC transporter substrate-binding protein, partial [Mycobacteriales bacterium]|nr:peptide ABC transporter substrate-binding protein [Mycobacteriales bacterium]